MVVKLFLLLVFLIIAPFGIWLLYDGLNDVAEASQSTNWPTAPGTITHSMVKASSTTTGRHRGTTYAPVISYAYAVAGTTYTSTTIVPGREWGLASAQEAVQLFPLGSKPNVSYSPTNPARSLLEPGLHAANFGQAMIGLFILTFASIFAVGIACAPLARKPDEPRPAKSRVPSRLLLVLVIATFLEFFYAIWLSR